MQHNACVHADTFQCSGIIVGVTVGAHKQIDNARAVSSFRPARGGVDVTQSGALRRR